MATLSSQQFLAVAASSGASTALPPLRRRPLLLPSPGRRCRILNPLLALKRPGVSTAPVEQAPSPEFDFEGEITRLQSLVARLRACNGIREKSRVLDGDSRVGVLLGERVRVLEGLGDYDVFLIKCLVAAGQEHVLGLDFEWGHFRNGRRKVEGSVLRTALYALADMVENWSLNGNGNENVNGYSNAVEYGEIEEVEMGKLTKLLKTLEEVEKFYDCIGGIIGYQLTALELASSSIVDRETTTWSSHSYKLQKELVNFYPPKGLDLSKNKEDATEAALWGIEGLPELGEIYPLGGAGDRLGLVDDATGECLPAALLPYCGRTLMEGLIRDLQAREFLYFKIYNKQCTTPVAIMTSSVKNNTAHITSLCERFGWFGRGRQNFLFFEQPLVPVVTAENGQWLLSSPLSPVCKPGGHGAIWKLAYDKGVFQWFYNHRRKAATLRQVSNVVAATDLTLLALAGIGLRYNKKLGFASCQRNSGATEGINVLVERQNLEGQWTYGITCIEYTEFEKFGITDAPNYISSLQGEFPANTNILYVDLRSAENVGSSQSIACLPGVVLNLKKRTSYMDHLGIQRSAYGGRLECTMQNIADSFSDTYNSRRSTKEIECSLSTFIVYNERKRVTSSAKRKRKHTDKSLHQTPDGALLDVMRNAYDLLSGCDIRIPKVEDNHKYLQSGPPFLIFLHPALGPLWDVTRQKFTGGSISEGSELQLEVAEFSWKNVQLDGSLIIIAENIMGSIRMTQNYEPAMHYGYRCGRCKLHNVKVLNRGIDWASSDNVYWKHDVQRLETLRIILHGNAEFEARDVVLQGNHEFEVPDGYRMRIISANSGFVVKLDPIDSGMMETGSWFWKYGVRGSHVHLQMVDLTSS